MDKIQLSQNLSNCNVVKKINKRKVDTLRKISDTGPSFSDAFSSCLTFSNPFIIACISSAKDFNCICKEAQFRSHSLLNTLTEIA